MADPIEEAAMKFVAGDYAGCRETLEAHIDAKDDGQTFRTEDMRMNHPLEAADDHLASAKQAMRNGQSYASYAEWMAHVSNLLERAAGVWQLVANAKSKTEDPNVAVISVDGGRNQIAWSGIPSPLIGDPSSFRSVVEAVLGCVTGEAEIVILALPVGAKVARPLDEALASMCLPSQADAATV